VAYDVDALLQAVHPHHVLGKVRSVEALVFKGFLKSIPMMCLLCESVGCAIRRVWVYSRGDRLLRKPKGPGRGPLETPTGVYRPWTPKGSALWCLCRLVPRYDPCSVVCMRFLPTDTHLSLLTTSWAVQKCS